MSDNQWPAGAVPVDHEIHTEAMHRDMVLALRKPPAEILAGLDNNKADLLHAILGIVSEAGELADAVKKHVIYGQPLNLENCKEELGDLEFYLAQIRLILGVTRVAMLQGNMDKLSIRYPGLVYSDKAAKERKDKQCQTPKSE